MEVVVAVVALLFLLFVTLGAYATVKAVRAAKRGVDRTIEQARRTVEDTTLRAKSYTQIGPVAELAQLRLRLRASMRATQDALHGMVGEDTTLGESLALFERLSVHGRELDTELRHLESEPDRALLARRMPELRERTERITASADSLRWAARDRARHFADDDLDMLSAQIDVETGALRHWKTSPHAEQPAEQPVQWPDPAPAEAPAAPPNPPSAPGPREADPTPPPRPALTEPTLPQAPYPWQKNTRPENTT
ncbi:hypothetical protein HUT18_08440 [Streptomyces sp. NA04227]|uniref:hypothetical protein n=1 Tax=Streptomyces sp. NA04227 TaxID=2742136 RepID=UPI0015908272|nr:hypothetical protein [Streptomyces sp. NA04227]QKW06429.1 hypothetical protein HUT18_08440 [Streptomyces sp. NA04227]